MCHRCHEGLERAASHANDGFTIFSGYRHVASARRLVHLLKYQGIVRAARPLVCGMARSLPADTTALVPVPRAAVRRIRYGIDPAVLLAGELSRATGVPVVAGLRARLWWPAHAGRTRDLRQTPRFVVVRTVPAGAVLVDDVATTGTTLRAAGRALGVDRAITATRADRSAFDRIGPRKMLNGSSSGASVGRRSGWQLFGTLLDRQQ